MTHGTQYEPEREGTADTCVFRAVWISSGHCSCRWKGLVLVKKKLFPAKNIHTVL